MKKIFIILAVAVLSMGISYAGNNGEKTVHLTKAEFLKKVVDYENNVNEWKYLGDKPAIIDFYADWCGPCKRLSPILEEIAAEYDGEVIIYKVNVDNERDIATAFGIRSLPTLFFVPKQGNPSVVEGFLPKEELYKAMNATILKK
ncbi:MAG: thioredoxin [Bacteroidaceae bacterium]|nr:thioredoxin [Bacteroidaceae bacterium]